MVVRATQPINANEEVIDYGNQSTRPAWKCLMSYGFVPSSEDDTSKLILEEEKIIIEVGPTELPFELIQYKEQLFPILFCF